MVDLTLKTEEEEMILAFDVSDEALEIATGTVSDKANFTWGGLHCVVSDWVPGLITDAGEIISPSKTRRCALSAPPW